MREYDIIIVGGGHAGCEAALAASRIGAKTLMLAINLDSIAEMPCNPNIGGSSKGHLVREVDALGGEMGKNIDKTYIQSRMLNTSKGPAVYSLRAQADKKKYHMEMKHTLELEPNLSIKQGEAVDIIIEGGKAAGVATDSGMIYRAKAIVLCMGTYLNARCLCGEAITDSGPNGKRGSKRLPEVMKNLGIKMLRFKTGTPARIDGKSIDYAKLSEQWGDENVVPFSFANTPEDIRRDQLPCYLTYTNKNTHEIIMRSIHRSPIYAGVIEGTGTRYCPSIEDKVVRFSDKDRHQVFIEPEGEDTCEMYISGMSTSLPEDVQEEMYRSVPGLENAEIMRPGYAIEYDCIDATQLFPTLEFRNFPGLFSAGQINGSSGYEEAAAQGIVAGINAAAYVLGREQLVIDRSQGYTGVLIDDLVTKGSREPYRMMTSRAEYRLLLRQDNADLRLTELGYKAGLIDERRYESFTQKRAAIDKEAERVANTVIAPSDNVNGVLEEHGSSRITTGAKLSELMRRPELDYDKLCAIDTSRPALDRSVAEEVNIRVKYEGYIAAQLRQVAQFKKLETKKLHADLDYSAVPGISAESRQKLSAMRPVNIGQASRITGVSPADISVLYAYITKD